MPDPGDNRLANLAGRMRQLETVVAGPWFSGSAFSLVDATFGPVFRYFGLIEERLGVAPTAELPAVATWRMKLAEDQVVKDAVTSDYPARRAAFMASRGTWISGLIGADA